MGTKNYSSWSLRPWLFLRKAGIDFREELIHFDAPDFRDAIARLSPSARVPLLIEGNVKIWDSLAICEYAAELAGRGLPRDPIARAVARSAAAEMHSGFAALRSECPMNVRARNRRAPATAALLADVARIDALWGECRARFGTAGPWLFGEFGVVDAMFAPVAFRFLTYGLTAPSAAGYLATLLDDPMMREWSAACAVEGHPLPDTDRLGDPG
jgi:glutathione S-transferase